MERDGKAVKKQEGLKDKSRSTTAIEKPEPIQLPPSFKDHLFKGDDMSELIFIYDHDLANYPENKLEEEEHAVTSVPSMSITNSSGTSQSVVNLPPSPASQDLDLKIASVRGFWDVDQMQPAMGFDQGMNSSSALGTTVSSESDNVMVTSSYPTFSSGDMDTDIVEHKTMELDQRQDENSLVGNGPMSTMSPRSQDGRSYGSNGSSQDNRSFNASVQDSLNFSSHVSVQDTLAFSSNDTECLTFVPHSSVQDTMQFTNQTVLQDSLGNYTSTEVSSTMDIKASEQSNVCKVKPQQLQQQLQAAQQLAVELDIVDDVDIPPSPPSPQLESMMSVSQPPFQPFHMGANQFVPQDHRGQHFVAPEPRQQQSQPNYGLSQTALGQSAYGLSQTGLGQSAFSQNSLFLPTTPTPDTYQQLSYQRNQLPTQPHVPPFGQPQPNTIMVSSATSSLMSTSIKPPNQSTYGTSMPKNITPNSLSFGQNMNNSSLQPSPQISFIQYDPNQLFGANALLGATQTQQNNASSQLLGSQLVQPRPAVQNVQQVQGNNSFYQQPPQQQMQQTSFFSQPNTSNFQHMSNTKRQQNEQLVLQACLLQAAAAGAGSQQFPLQFGNQPGANLNLSFQQQSQMTMPPCQSSSTKSSQFNPSGQQGSPQSTPLKSPPQSLTPTNSFGGISSVGQQNQNSKLFGLGQNHAGSTPRFTNVGFTKFSNNMPQFTQKLNTQFVQQPMQTGGSTSKLSDTKCGPCDVREKNIKPLYWCMSCEEGLCAECYDHHRAIKAIRNHSVVPLESVKPLEQFVSSFKTNCSIHDKPLELFCPCHEEPCCTKCASLSHPNCIGITLFQAVVSDLKRSDKLTYVDNDIGTLLKNIDLLIENRKINLKEITDQAEKKIDLFQVLKEELKDLEIKMQSKYHDLHVSAYAEIEAAVAKLQKKRQMISDYKNNFSQLKQIGADSQLFHGTKQMEKFIKEEGKALNEVVKEPPMQEMRIKAKMSDNFKQIISNLLDVNIERENSKVNLKDIGGSLTCQSVKDNQTDVSVVQKTQTEFDKSVYETDRNICSLVEFPGGDIAVTDYQYQQLLIFDSNGSVKKKIHYPSRPFGLTVVNTDKFAVSFPVIGIIKIYLLNTFTEKDEILIGDADEECWGLQYEDDLFIAAIRNVEILFLHLSGIVQKTIPMKQKNLVYVLKRKERHYRTEFENHSVHCYSSTNGRKEWQFSHPTALGPRNMCFDAEGNLFVACQDSNCVILISGDGKHFKRVVEMSCAKCIYFDVKKSLLYVCSVNGKEMASFSIPKNFGSF